MRLFLLAISLLMSVQIVSAAGFIVKYKNTKNITSGKAIIQEMGFYKVNSIPKNLSNIQYIEPIVYYHISPVKQQDESDYQEIKWDMLKIDGLRAWDISGGSEDIIVAVIDTGCDYNHEDLKNNIWTNAEGKHGYDFVNRDDDPMDDNSHGTHCSGSIGAEHNNKGIAGVNKKVKIMCLKFLSGEGSGSSEDAILAIKWAVDNGARVLSNSWGGGGFSQALYDVIKYAKDKGVIFIAAAGNDGDSGNEHYPSSYDLDNIISVAASDDKDSRASFSNYGVPHVDIAAPGKGIESTIPGNKYASYSGTSMATPHVAGAAALLLSREPNLSIAELKDRILWTSDYLPEWEDVVLSAGRINLFNMLMNIRPDRPMPPPEDKWVSESVSIETPHPYANNKTYKYEISIPLGAQFVRLHFVDFATEARYDVVKITVGSKSIEYSGSLGSFNSKYFPTEEASVIKIELKADYSIVGNGFKIDRVDHQ